MLELRRAPIQHDAGRLAGTVVNWDMRSNPIVQAGRNHGKPFVERVQRGAFDLSGNIPMILRHDMRALVANTKSGLLKLVEDERSLSYEVTLPDTSVARDARALVESGVLTEMSFGFIALSDAWKGDERSLLRADLREISLVEDGAHKQTSAEARALARVAQNLRLRLRIASCR